ncbi:tyrosine-type recombinase/integrase [Bermanella sp. WJH001]|uniref:tyrosine-type recombinase/integrase n=1 Tax=Bermanella sp. WJH001 TaxID=3048005 RepID=UPI0024BE222F|nr:site-specific integrase [Bermanella sp. WJH001]MDJ1537029.1 site-specific integrase [Bermanella sp. WJH001]
MKNEAIPYPIFDNLQFLPDAFKYSPKEIAAHLSDAQQQDYFYGVRYLLSYKGSTATFNSYRREVERLLQWLWQVKQFTLCDVKREHIEEFMEFCISPPLHWIGNKNVARFKSKQGERVGNNEWRPFVSGSNKATGERVSANAYSLSQKAIQSSFAILSSFFNFLIQEEYISANPVTLVRQRSRFIQKSQNQEPVRRISNYQWDEVIRVAEALALKDPVQHERTLFILNCLLGMYLRISELVADERSIPVMGDFRPDRDRNWWFHVVGKGNKSRIITVSNGMLDALKRYRTHLGLSALPYLGEQTPLVPKSHGNGPVTSTRQIRNLVQVCFNQAYDNLVKAGQESEAMELKVATVHWLRHTGISEDVKIRPREHVKEDAGHSSMATTDKYIDSELRERHASAINKKIRREPEEL